MRHVSHRTARHCVTGETRRHAHVETRANGGGSLLQVSSSKWADHLLQSVALVSQANAPNESHLKDVAHGSWHDADLGSKAAAKAVSMRSEATQRCVNVLHGVEDPSWAAELLLVTW